MRIILNILIFIGLIGLSAPARAQTNATETVLKTIIERVFSETEERVIKDYFGIDKKNDEKGKRKHKAKNGKGGLPPGLAKRDALPPGLAKQLNEKGALPPGLEKRDLPDDLLSSLPKRKGTKRVIVDDDIVLIEEGTNIVLDVLENILTSDQ